jgi:hypothetical protein
MVYKVHWQIVFKGGKTLSGTEDVCVRGQKATPVNKADAKRLARLGVYQTHLRYCAMSYKTAIAMVDVLGVEAVEVKAAV